MGLHSVSEIVCTKSDCMQLLEGRMSTRRVWLLVLLFIVAVLLPIPVSCNSQQRISRQLKIGEFSLNLPTIRPQFKLLEFVLNGINYNYRSLVPKPGALRYRLRGG